MKIILLAFSLLPCLGMAEYQVLIRTNEPLPLVITKDTDMSDVLLVDNNMSRPAIILINATLNLGYAHRKTDSDHDKTTDPGLGVIFNGVFLPELRIEFDHHDFDRSFISAMGTFHLNCNSIFAETCVSVTANWDGTYGNGSTVNLGKISGYRFGVLASGQNNLDVSIAQAKQYLWPSTPSPGHTFYGNESSCSGTFLRLNSPKVRVASIRGVAMAPNIRCDHVSAKFKGSWNVDYECLDDQNPCGALDQYGSSGTAHIFWQHPGGDAANGKFLAFRSGTGSFGDPNGMFYVTGAYDSVFAPDQTVPRYRWESLFGRFQSTFVHAGGAPYADTGTNTQGVINT